MDVARGTNRWVRSPSLVPWSLQRDTFSKDRRHGGCDLSASLHIDSEPESWDPFGELGQLVDARHILRRTILDQLDGHVA